MKKLLTTHYSLLTNRGFSIIELLVVTAIIATFSVVLVLNFRSSPKNQVARSQTAAAVVSDIRRIQSMASAGSRFQGNVVCGYGIHYVSSTSYILYAGVLDGGATRCQDTNHNYQAGIDLVVETKNIINSNMEMRSSFSDVIFEPPDPKTYINNSALLTGPSATITIQLKAQASCAGTSCTLITIFPSGQIDTAN